MELIDKKLFCFPLHLEISAPRGSTIGQSLDMYVRDPAEAVALINKAVEEAKSGSAPPQVQME